jgi:CrcB protein
MTPDLAAWVIVAGAVGSVLRYLVGRVGVRASWPWPVLLVNVVGSLVAGLGIHSDLSLIVVTGFAGGLTTFSTLSVETVQLFLSKRWRSAVASVAANLVLGITAAIAGWFLGLALFG